MPVTINGTTGIAGVDGSASTPAVQGSDTNTGEFFPAADTIAWTTGGSERMRVDSSGNVGIGTSSPAAKLEVVNSADAAIQVTSGNNVSRVILNNTGTGGRKWTFTAGNTAYSAGALYLEDSTAGATRLAVDSSGNLLVNTTTAKGIVTVKASANNDYSKSFGIVRSDTTDVWNMLITSTNDLYFGLNNVNKAYVNNSTGAWTAVSDRRLKKDISEIQYGLSDVMKLKPVSYLMETEEDTASKHLGFIAQDVQEVLPEAVGEMFDGMLSLDKTEIIAVLVKAIQELSAKVDAQAAEIAALKANAPA